MLEPPVADLLLPINSPGLFPRLGSPMENFFH
uniref:Uncharacterized protein n=1 Tax=Nelumbo nucifera TaxID=4432 RepID=A0A822Y2Q1_NELNU|nr:TPA_asm: hypothetical protein HUJ06_027063 [Nelumbo nucifera]DAD25655.1 TPA_asm: hypothetical protein HUJ06_027119 [Nelumbo nucifera]